MAEFSKFQAGTEFYDVKDAKVRSNIASVFTSVSTYYPDDYVQYDGVMYKFINQHQGAWTTTDVVQVNIGDEFNISHVGAKYDTEHEGIVFSATAPSTLFDSLGKSSSEIVAPDFSTTTSYSANDYVIYDHKIYKFTTTHSAGAWDGNDVEEVAITDEFTPIYNALHVTGPLPAGSSMSKTFTSTGILDGMRVVNYSFGTPANVLSDINWVIPDGGGSITFSGNIATGGTNISFELIKMPSITLT